MQQRLTLQNLQAHLGNEVKKRRNNSDESSSAQSNKLLVGRMLSDSTESSRILDIIQNDKLALVLRVVLELQFLHGLRISEVLNITPLDITRQGRIRIKGLKGSFDRFVLSSYYKDFWLNSGISLLPLCTTYSRFYFYREYKKLSIGAYFGNSQNKSITHYFRHAVALDSQEQYESLTDTKMVLGHKSIKSTEKYVKRRKL
jgi:site-specific recombinase XerD